LDWLEKREAREKHVFTLPAIFTIAVLNHGSKTLIRLPALARAFWLDQLRRTFTGN
jgi:hypothetical protein